MRLLDVNASIEDLLNWKEWLEYPGTIQELMGLELLDVSGNKVGRVQSLDLDTGTAMMHTNPMLMDLVNGEVVPVKYQYQFKVLTAVVGDWSKKLTWD